MKKTIKIKSRIDTFELDLNIPENWNEEKIVVACHGFNSSKDSEAMMLIEEDLSKYGIAYARFSWPYHAERRIDRDDFSVEKCIEDLYLVENTIKEEYPKTKIGIYANSFGAYLTLLRLKRKEHDFFAIALRAPAIKMDEILELFMANTNIEEIKKHGYILDKPDKKPMEIKYDFYEELKENRISQLGEYKEKMLIYHGTADDVAPCEDTIEFAKKNKNVKLVLFENELHKFNIEKLEQANAEIAIYMKDESTSI